MKKLFLILLAGVILSGCYTTLYPPANMNIGSADAVPDSTRQIIVNNYYETTEYYQIPHYRRYSLLWNDYYWDPFYYDYGYYSWRPYYWYGHYYYYNPHNHYWYYYDRHYSYDRHHRWDSGNWSGGSSGGSSNKDRIHKPGYNVLMNSPTGSAPFVSVGTDNGRVTKPVKKVGVNINSGVENDNSYHPQIQSVGKKPLSGSNSSSTYLKKTTTSSNNPSSTNKDTKKSSSSSSYQKQNQSSSNSSSSSNGKSKSSSTSSSSSKNSSNESSSTSSKKSK
ncbi:MAG: hypothetical protein K9N05_05880 [Candidatus Marinimicrobia bacterium]|nr:hypothetical protein [Candidatus Neomarinimicrobiota bacterium]